MREVIDSREKGNVPMSIGTSFAIEGFCGFGEHIQRNPPCDKCSELWVNIRTIYRNIGISFDNQSRNQMMSGHLAEAMMEDMAILTSTVELKTQGKVKVVFYYCEHKGLKSEFPLAMLKQLKTDRQLFEKGLEEETFKIFFKEIERVKPDWLTLEKYNVKITDKSGNVAILTHQPIDLLWRKQFNKLFLLESHTGLLKDSSEWHTKLTGGKKYNRIPFNRLTIQLLGDQSNYFASMKSSFKKIIFDLSEKDNWTPVTSYDKIRNSLKKIPDPMTRQYFLDLLGKQ